MTQTNPTKNFAVIGVAGYIAIRHVKAIKETGNRLVASLDKFDSVGFLDSYFPESDFFIEFERFDRHVEKLKREGLHLDYVSICSPNYMHDSHIRFALRVGADAICEKPIVLNPWNIDALQEIEKESGKSIYNILQLRLHPSIIALKKKIDEAPKDKMFDIDLTYITSRGKWYFFSWKGDMSKSGGIATNIGVHFFDMLTWIFGDVKENIVHVSTPETASGFLQLEKARVRWFLSVDQNALPVEVLAKGQRTYRSITVNGESLEFSDGFTDLHTESYKGILNGNGFRISETRKSIETVYDIRKANTVGLKGEFHPFCKNSK
ncbi:MAG: oxidoreductase [Bacteroidetes bacterium RIFOXYA12_FULL_35_11]|nr:MAG: oxidoreductase [Bacteroidetes bacterium GWF2_35_48]OFY75329.1 MAG: oxidoreductase [Bacteroidetes bacterium RIFOXYA12_FULL_35_11]OFY94826.1 MAG: oxidoreductase [Bacteroidetes bacterium RIFOXYC12_FULL_35_7]OFY96912.1 MAG: oxidoreductase [Bacteroidetes bacterium RIFOXYB2_FULL_35_7]HBX53470.1 oxidoreductase [Bacteroidales bacterium]